MSLPEVQQMVVAEKTELDTKIKALRAYCGSPAYRKLVPDDQRMLVRQLQAMAAYSQALGERIAVFEAAEHAALSQQGAS